MIPDHRTRHLLARRLRQLHFERNWSQETLAAQAGLHRTYISGIERWPLSRIPANAPCVALPPAIPGGRLRFAAFVRPVRQNAISAWTTWRSWRMLFKYR